MANHSPAFPETLITTYLEMTDISQLRPSAQPEGDLLLLHAVRPDIDYYRFLYRGVGDALRWRDRLLMEDADLEHLIHRPNCHIRVLHVGGVPAGYFELVDEDGTVELDYFGLRPAFQGRGLGGWLLTQAIEGAFAGGARRLWVHTCNLDGPAALPNYQRRGFQIYQTTEAPMPARYKD